MTAAVSPANELSRAQWRQDAAECERDHGSGRRRDRRPGRQWGAHRADPGWPGAAAVDLPRGACSLQR
jgi:hypothetical protein